MHSYVIDDPIVEPLTSSIEVTVQFDDGERRWLFFATPALLGSVGDYVDGTKVRVHLGERHMIVVSKINATVIESVLRSLNESGELYSRTLPLDSAAL